MTATFRSNDTDALFVQAMREIEQRMARAATGAVREAMAGALAEGRANIAGAGFSERWQSGLRARIFPESGASIDASGTLFHAIPYAGIFEEGGTIFPEAGGLLWIPLTGAPLPAGARRPRDVARLVGGLASINRPGRRPLLVAKRRSQFRQNRRPLFVGVESVTIRKRFDIIAIVRKWADRLPELFSKHLRTD